MEWRLALRYGGCRRSRRPGLRALLLARLLAFWTSGWNPELLLGEAGVRRTASLPARWRGRFRCELICLYRPAIRSDAGAGQVLAGCGIALTLERRWRGGFRRSRKVLRRRVRVGCVSCRGGRFRHPGARIELER